jgi:phage/plasmid-like protein (TIGR03299 family)
MRNETPWNREFDPTPLTIEAALTAAELDWEVLSKPAYYLDNPEEVEEDEDAFLSVEPVPNYFVNVRSDTGVPLGIVTRRYSPFHNFQAFAWLGQIFGTEMDFVAAGEFMNSRRVWVLMRVPAHVEIAGEKIGQYAFVHTSHDGKHSVTASMTPYLVRTATLMTSEVRRARNYNAQRTIAIRHVGNMDEKVQAEEAQRVMGVSINYYEQFVKLGQLLAEIKVEPVEAQEYTELLLPVDEKQGERAQRNTEAARDTLLTLFRQNGENNHAPDTWWSLYTAALEFADWVRPQRKPDGRFQRALDDPDSFKANAWDFALAQLQMG